jgi:hypothetical protein
LELVLVGAPRLELTATLTATTAHRGCCSRPPAIRREEGGAAARQPARSYGSEGCRFESCRVHTGQRPLRITPEGPFSCRTAAEYRNGRDQPVLSSVPVPPLRMDLEGDEQRAARVPGVPERNHSEAGTAGAQGEHAGEVVWPSLQSTAGVRAGTTELLKRVSHVRFLPVHLGTGGEPVPIMMRSPSPRPPATTPP